GSMLRFDGDGLRLLSPPPAPAGRPSRAAPNAPEENIPVLRTDDRPGPAAGRAEPHPRTRNAAPMSPHSSDSGPRVLDVLFTGLYAIGACFVILFLFLPLIDRAKLEGQRAKIDAGDQEQNRLDRRLNEDGDRKDTAAKDSTKDGPPRPRTSLEDDRRRREDEKKDWEKQKRKLEEQLEDMRTTARTSTYWYTWGMLVGYLILAFASAGFVVGGSTPLRPVLGASTLLVQALLAFLLYLCARGAGMPFFAVVP